MSASDGSVNNQRQFDHCTLISSKTTLKYFQHLGAFTKKMISSRLRFGQDACFHVHFLGLNKCYQIRSDSMFMPTTEISEPFQIVVKSPIKTKNMKVQTQHVEHGLR